MAVTWGTRTMSLDWYPILFDFFFLKKEKKNNNNKKKKSIYIKNNLG